jgi:hypothetical protein
MRYISLLYARNYLQEYYKNISTFSEHETYA